MSSENIDSKFIPGLEDDDSTIYTANTPPETVVTDLLGDHDQISDPKLSLSSVPWPGSTFIIRSASSGHVLTLLNGQVKLSPPGTPGGCIHWACEDTEGWLSFRNTASGCFLGHAGNGRLRCEVKHHMLWEWFCVRMHPNGGYVLLMMHEKRLWVVGAVEDGKLAKIGEREKLLYGSL